MLPIDAKLVERFYRQANAERWRVPMRQFAGALEASAARGCADRDPRALERYLGALHLEDVALACACAAGDDGAWDHFVLEHRPLLYRAADAIEPGGAARELADSLYADLFGLRDREGERQSLFRYFHGRSSLSTWLRAVLAQRHVDRLRTNRRLEALPDEESSRALEAPVVAVEPDRSRHLELMRMTLQRAVAQLPARDRLRLACYYAQELTLAETGRLLGEHEATSSRQLARTRKAIREDVERQLRDEHRLSEAEVTQCFASVAADAGPLDLRQWFHDEPPEAAPRIERKESAPDRSS
jgi:RNA polymerase sigma-70 factor (ECF subfamily)